MTPIALLDTGSLRAILGQFDNANQQFTACLNAWRQARGRTDTSANTNDNDFSDMFDDVQRTVSSTEPAMQAFRQYHEAFSLSSQARRCSGAPHNIVDPSASASLAATPVPGSQASGPFEADAIDAPAVFQRNHSKAGSGCVELSTNTAGSAGLRPSFQSTDPLTHPRVLAEVQSSLDEIEKKFKRDGRLARLVEARAVVHQFGLELPDWLQRYPPNHSDVDYANISESWQVAGLSCRGLGRQFAKVMTLKRACYIYTEVRCLVESGTKRDHAYDEVSKELSSTFDASSFLKPCGKSRSTVVRGDLKIRKLIGSP